MPPSLSWWWWDYLSENTLIEILKHLPARSLLRFRCVSQRWKEVIDSHEFMEEHLSVQQPRLLIRYGDADDETVFSALELSSPILIHSLATTIPVQGHLYSVFGTLHGVVCLYDGARDLLLWNPSIGNSKLLTIPFPLDFRVNDIHDRWIFCSAFWIDSSTKEFKIIILLYELVVRVKLVDLLHKGIIYSSINREWSVIPTAEVRRRLGRDWSPSHHQPLMIGGVAHWQGRYGDKPRSEAVLRFDFTQESFEYIDLYPPLGEIMQWQGALSVLRVEPNPDQTGFRFDIHIRQQQGKWTNVFSFNLCSPPRTAFLSVVKLETRFGVLIGTPIKSAQRLQDDDYDYDDYDDDAQVERCKLGFFDDTVGGWIHLMDHVVTWPRVTSGFVESLLFP